MSDSRRVTPQEAMQLLEALIATPSFSREEEATADLLQQFLAKRAVPTERVWNNVWALQPHHDPAKPTLMLNSHHDTVRPSAGYTRDPFVPVHCDGRLYGLGSNDAGASLVALLALFVHYYTTPLPFNLLLALTAEEEVGGEHGIRALLPELSKRGITPTMGLVGEPTSMQAALAERGLVVLDCTAVGRSGHAARDEGENALYKALDDITRLRNLRFERESALLGPIRLTVTQIEAGTQHNLVPDRCRFVVDVRTTDAYTNEQTVELIRQAILSEAQPRSTRIRASVIGEEHPLVQAALATGATPFCSPTTSDRTLMPFPALKMGIGDSARSHTADEYILETELEAGMAQYVRLIDHLTRLTE